MPKMTKTKNTMKRTAVATGALPSERSVRSLTRSKRKPEPKIITQQETATGALPSTTPEPLIFDPASISNMANIWELVGIKGPKFPHTKFQDYVDWVSQLANWELDAHAEDMKVLMSGTRETMIDRLEENFLDHHRDQRVEVAKARQREREGVTTAEESTFHLMGAERRTENARAREKAREPHFTLEEQAKAIMRRTTGRL